MTTATTTTIQLPAATIELRPGERYSGAVLDQDGNVKHHLILLPDRPAARVCWQDAMAWAESVDGQLPDRQEQALLFANCKPHLQKTWHWSSETHEEDASYAWNCYFSNGYQDYYRKGYEGSAVAVRRLIP